MGLQGLPAGPLNILQAQKMFLQAQLRRTVAPGRPLSEPLATPLFPVGSVGFCGYSHRNPVGMGWGWVLKFHSHGNPGTPIFIYNYHL